MISTIQFEHGDNTCQTESGTPCRFAVTADQTSYTCRLFADTPIVDNDGSLQRCDACVANQVSA